MPAASMGVIMPFTLYTTGKDYIFSDPLLRINLSDDAIIRPQSKDGFRLF